MKMNKLFLIFCAALLLGGCQSTGKTAVKPEYQPLNYTEADAIRAELERVEKRLAEKPVEALWRSALMRNIFRSSGADDALSGEIEALFARCADTVSARCAAAAADSKYMDALRYYRALKTVESPAFNALPYSEAGLTEKLMAGVPGSGTQKPSGTAPTMAAYINGTVTVWVDKGIKVENGMGYADAALGSGFFIDRQGFIITNHHVIQPEVDPKYEGFSRLYVKLAQDPDTKIPAKVVGWDPILDLALLKAEVDAPYVFTLGSSTELDPGDRVFAIGSPLGLDKTLTSGIVSAVNRKLFSVGGVMQIDAAVNSGNSGGPLIDSAGNVQAVVFAGMLKYQGLNFAIPVEYLIATLPQLAQGGKRGQSWIGGYGRTWRDGEVSGVEVQYVLPGGSAARSSIAAGDIITAINSQAALRLEDLQNALILLPPDSIVKLDGLRADGTAFSVPVYLENRPVNPGLDVYERDVIASAFTPIFGMELTPISAAVRKQYSVARILKGSIADESGFSVQDPVDVLRVRISKEKDLIYAELYTKKRKNGYFDVNIAIGAPLDSPWYF
ncbi:MAG: S1C family serine protease [Treponema sp.]|jgi:S1-C subfamily serine protease|nr:S1C family serine protease [Treponema sp.]